MDCGVVLALMYFLEKFSVAITICPDFHSVEDAAEGTTNDFTCKAWALYILVDRLNSVGLPQRVVPPSRGVVCDFGQGLLGALQAQWVRSGSRLIGTATIPLGIVDLGTVTYPFGISVIHVHGNAVCESMDMDAVRAMCRPSDRDQCPFPVSPWEDACRVLSYAWRPMALSFGICLSLETGFFRLRTL